MRSLNRGTVSETGAAEVWSWSHRLTGMTRCCIWSIFYISYIDFFYDRFFRFTGRSITNFDENTLLLWDVKGRYYLRCMSPLLCLLIGCEESHDMMCYNQPSLYEQDLYPVVITEWWSGRSWRNIWKYWHRNMDVTIWFTIYCSPYYFITIIFIKWFQDLFEDFCCPKQTTLRDDVIVQQTRDQQRPGDGEREELKMEGGTGGGKGNLVLSIRLSSTIQEGFSHYDSATAYCWYFKGLIRAAR